MKNGYDFEAMPKKRMAASALFLDEQGKILIVKPTYRPDWLLPGGIVEDHESPRQACLHEIKEELNIETPLDKLLCVEHLSDDTQQTESVQFVFYGGLIPTSQLPYMVNMPPPYGTFKQAQRVRQNGAGVEQNELFESEKA